MKKVFKKIYIIKMNNMINELVNDIVNDIFQNKKDKIK